ncbi:hypothetical protein EOD39_13237 [Acipenser ruthenus]|uniref:Uncharacterized protein n=1 Tax=Acipenser ruthenus TaxID=7906 RepID=A0A444UJ51_ACIRT|nr:hypothetical protein EOD39_13237 [Acipenser ruthenus]
MHSWAGFPLSHQEGVLQIPGEPVIALASLETPPLALKAPQKHRPPSVCRRAAKQSQLDPTSLAPNWRKRKPHWTGSMGPRWACYPIWSSGTTCPPFPAHHYHRTIGVAGTAADGYSSATKRGGKGSRGSNRSLVTELRGALPGATEPTAGTVAELPPQFRHED